MKYKNPTLLLYSLSSFGQKYYRHVKSSFEPSVNPNNELMNSDYDPSILFLFKFSFRLFDYYAPNGNRCLVYLPSTTDRNRYEKHLSVIIVYVIERRLGRFYTTRLFHNTNSKHCFPSLLRTALKSVGCAVERRK